VPALTRLHEDASARKTSRRLRSETVNVGMGGVYLFMDRRVDADAGSSAAKAGAADRSAGEVFRSSGIRGVGACLRESRRQGGISPADVWVRKGAAPDMPRCGRSSGYAGGTADSSGGVKHLKRSKNRGAVGMRAAPAVRRGNPPAVLAKPRRAAAP
jgi:hypothetical protein